MTIQTRVLINLTTHSALVTVSDQGQISVFKYDDCHCAWDQFEDNEEFAASDFITTSLPRSYSRVRVYGDQDTDSAF